MNAKRRYLSMALGTISLLILGFVVAVAARTRPGGNVDEPVLRLDTAFDFDWERLLWWTVFILAMVGAVLFAVGVKQSGRRKADEKRNYLGMFAVVVIFVILFRFFRPLTDTFFGAASDTNEVGEVGSPDGRGSSGTAGWLFSLLVAAVVTATLTRIGLATREGQPSFGLPQPVLDEVEEERSTHIRFPELGDDPRSRVLRAYSTYERAVGERGVERKGTETAARHARRAADQLDLDRHDVNSLMGYYSSTRFGPAAVTLADAENAEAVVARLAGGSHQ